MDTNSIFISHDEVDKNNDIAGKVTYTNIMEIIPEDSTETPMKNWKENNKTEWRWRFLKFNNRIVAEISYMKPDFAKRFYFNRYGDWVERELGKVYEQYVFKTYYYYTDN